MDLALYIGNRIKYYRNINKLTQGELGEKLGVKKATVSHYENGIRTPDQNNLFELAEIFDTSIDDLFPPREYSGILSIYSQLEPPRQQKVYNLAGRELEEQRYIQDHDDYVGQTAAGAPIEGQQPVPMLGSDTVKLLVNGDSMQNLFRDGDIVEYHPQPELENGEIGVFAVNG